MHGSPFRSATVIRPIRSFLHKHSAVLENGKWMMPDDVPPPLNQVKRVREEALKIIGDSAKKRPSAATPAHAPPAHASDCTRHNIYPNFVGHASYFRAADMSEGISFDQVSNASGDSSMEQDAWASAERNCWPSLTPPPEAKKFRTEGMIATS